MPATMQTQWEGAELERAGRQWRRTVCKLVDSAEICTCATLRIGRLSAYVCVKEEVVGTSGQWRVRN